MLHLVNLKQILQKQLSSKNLEKCITLSKLCFLPISGTSIGSSSIDMLFALEGFLVGAVCFVDGGKSRSINKSSRTEKQEKITLRIIPIIHKLIYSIWVSRRITTISTKIKHIVYLVRLRYAET